MSTLLVNTIGPNNGDHIDITGSLHFSASSGTPVISVQSLNYSGTPPTEILPNGINMYGASIGYLKIGINDFDYYNTTQLSHQHSFFQGKVSFFGTISSSLEPYTDNVFQLGDYLERWKEIHANKIYSDEHLVYSNLNAGNASIQSRILTNSSSLLQVRAAETASLHVSGTGVTNIVFDNLPTSEPTVTGSLWLSGSGVGSASGSKYLMVFSG